jgi:DNA-binding SARP family transcriptional activator
VRSSLSLVEFRVLGPVEAAVEGRPVPLPAAKPRALLALMLLNRNRVVSAGALIDQLWGEVPPETAAKALQGYVSQLRKVLGPERVVTKPPGYAFQVGEGELDLDRFESLVGEGRERLAEGDAKKAATRLAEALSLWRGPALTEFDEPFARDAGARLDESRLAAIEDRIEADLALGRHARLIPELEQLLAAEPFRERLRGQLMLALYRSDRQAEALEAYRRTRETLSDELGIEPSPGLQELERRILQHDPDLVVPRLPPSIVEPTAPRTRQLVPLMLAVVALVAVALAFALTRDSSSGNGKAEQRAFVTKVENFLTQSREGRLAVFAALKAAGSCDLTPRAAAERLNRVQRNRQSLLQQVAALSVPDSEEALQSSDLLQKAAHASIAADWHYRDWLLNRTRCGPPVPDTDLHAAWAADAKATKAKRAFLAVFDPLARRFGQRVWTAREF